MVNAEKIRVAVFGAGGRMGATVCRAVADAPDLELVGAIDPFHEGLDLRQVTGVEQRTRGQIWFGGEEVHFKGPLDAREAGIETVFQNLALADDLDVPSNLFLGRERILFNLGKFSILDRRAMREATVEGLKRTGVKIPNLDNTIRHMSGGQRQCVAIARAATFASKLIIMDEPTAALGVQETAQVENIIRNLKKKGVPLILVSHNLRQVFDLVDKIWVFRRGRIAGMVEAGSSDGNEVVARVDRLNMPSYTGFVQPRLEAVYDEHGSITDVKIAYPMDLTTQMLEYSGRRSMAPQTTGT